MKLIKLTQNRLACVDAEDFDWLSKWSWHYHRMEKRKTGYARRTDYSGPKQKTVSMHVEIMKRHGRRGREVDHIDNCGCDNRKENLRLATRKGQGANVGLRVVNTSGVTGVSWHEQAGKWHARININGKIKHLGYYDDDDDFNEAVEARRKAEIEHYGEFQHDPTKVCPLGYTGQCPECAARLRGNNVH